MLLFSHSVVACSLEPQSMMVTHSSAGEMDFLFISVCLHRACSLKNAMIVLLQGKISGREPGLVFYLFQSLTYPLKIQLLLPVNACFCFCFFFLPKLKGLRNLK